MKWSRVSIPSAVPSRFRLLSLWENTFSFATNFSSLKPQDFEGSSSVDVIDTTRDIYFFTSWVIAAKAYSQTIPPTSPSLICLQKSLSLAHTENGRFQSLNIIQFPFLINIMSFCFNEFSFQLFVLAVLVAPAFFSVHSCRFVCISFPGCEAEKSLRKLDRRTKAQTMPTGGENKESSEMIN